MVMYHEHQRGGLCRLHAVNTVFGRKEFDTQTFSMFVNDHNAVSFDMIDSRQEYVMSMMIGSKGLTTFYVAPYAGDTILHRHGLQHIRELIDPKVNTFMVLQPDHVFTVKKGPMSHWWSIDSHASGPIRTQLDASLSDDRFGYLFVWSYGAARSCITRMRKILVDWVSMDIDMDSLCSVQRRYIIELVTRDINDSVYVENFEQPIVLFLKYYRYVKNLRPDDTPVLRFFRSWFNAFSDDQADRVNIMEHVPSLIWWILLCMDIDNTDTIPDPEKLKVHWRDSERNVLDVVGFLK